MKIAIATNLFPPVVSGTASYSRDVCRELKAIGHDVYLIVPEALLAAAPTDLIDRDRILPLRSWRVPPTRVMLGFTQLRSTLWPGNTGTVTEFLKKHGVEYVYQQSHVFDTALHTRFACQSLRIPRAIAHHTNISHPNPIIDGPLRLAERLIIRSLYMKDDDLWICPDAFTVRYCEERFPDLRRQQVMYGVGPLPDCTRPDVVERAKKLRAQHSRLVVSLGHMTRARDRMDLIHAIQRLKPKYPDAGMVVIGDTQVEYPIEEAKKLGLQDSIHFLGKVPRDELKPYMDHADVEAHWYYDNSTFGVATLESMATGICCLASCPADCYGPDLFREGDHYMRVKSADPADIAEKLAILFERPDERKRIAEAGAKLVAERLSWRSVAENLTTTFERHRDEYRRS